jgi:4-amino-4-deoxy-L-arabinose transferase-like glycosyltransferase
MVPLIFKEESMIAAAPPPEIAPAPTPWWREPQIALLIALVWVGYFMRLGDVSMRGEEPTRAQIAFALIESGDWIVPRVYGEVFHSRPPLQNWLIAASSMVLGSRDAWAVRLPSALAMLGTTLLIYGYARTRMSRGGAFAAACAFATFGEMFTTGAQAETDMVFTALLSGALLLWHWGQLREWPAWRSWTAGYVLVALAMLCKGPQPPVYFGAATVSYLLITGQWRRVFSVAHIAGLLAGAAVLFGWLLPCADMTSWPETKMILISDSAARLLGWTTFDVVTHLVQFPLEFLGCTLPWSPLLVAYASGTLRRALGAARPQALFTALAVGIAFVTIWLPPDGQTRYFTPLYPCVAVLIGGVIDCVLRADAAAVLRARWQRFTGLMALGMIGAAVAVVLAAGFLAGHPHLDSWAESPLRALGYALALLVLAALAWRGRMQLAVLAIACFMIVTFTGYLTDVRVRRSEDQAALVAQVKTQLSPGKRLVNYGAIDLLFAYYFETPIEQRPMPKAAEVAVAENGCFSFYSIQGWRPTLPFAWEEVAVIPMNRNRSSDAVPDRAMVVGRRLPMSYTPSDAQPPIVPVSRQGKTP